MLGKAGVGATCSGGPAAADDDAWGVTLAAWLAFTATDAWPVPTAWLAFTATDATALNAWPGFTTEGAMAGIGATGWLENRSP